MAKRFHSFANCDRTAKRTGLCDDDDSEEERGKKKKREKNGERGGKHEKRIVALTIFLTDNGIGELIIEKAVGVQPAGIEIESNERGV